MTKAMQSQPQFQAGLISTAEMFLPLGPRNLSFKEDKKKRKKAVGTCFNLTLFPILRYFSDPGWF